MKFNNKLKKGFTLVELIVVIAIVAILAAVSVVSYLAFINSANESADVQLVKQLNTALQGDQALNGIRKTPTEMLGAMEENGFVIENLTKTKSGYDIVWDQKNNRFALLNGESSVYAESSFNNDGYLNKSLITKLVDNVEEATAATNLHYSVYLTEAFGDAENLNVSSGVDVGNNVINTINYVNDVDHPQTVVVRTNGGTLKINAENDTVKHYGKASSVKLTAVSNNSFYEYGFANQVNIKKGRLVLTNNENAYVNTVYLEKTEDTYDGIILATQNGADLPTFIARDSVSEPETGEKLVVTIQTNVNEQGEEPEKTEAIYLYPTKDVKEESNGYDVSDLGLLVVEAISSTAQAEAAEVIADPEVLERVEATKADCAAIVDSIGYTTFANAWNAGTNKTVILLKDVILNGIPVVNSKTVDLNQHSLTLKGAQLGDGQECAIWICRDWGNDYDGKLTLKNGSLMLPGTNYNHYGIYCYGSLLNCQNLVIQSNCNEAIHFEGHQYGSNYTSELNNVTINSTGTGIQSNGYKGSFFGNVIPTVNLSNSTIYSENGTAFAINGSKANVTNSIFNPSAGQKSLHVYSSGTASGLAPELTLTGSIMCNGNSDTNKLSKNAGTVTIKEGTYNFNPTNYVDEEVYSISSQNNLWIVAIK